MMMNIETLICCPFCKQDLIANLKVGPQLLPRDKLHFYYCKQCDRKFPLEHSILDFLPDKPKQSPFIQQLMESNSLVSIYEGKAWRQSTLFSWFTGISLKKEMALIKKIAHLNKNAVVLDLACGTGLYSRYLAKESGARAVIGLDLSWPMLRHAVKLIEDQRVYNVTYMHGDALALPFKDASFDAAVCCGALHLFSDVHQALDELNRVIKPNGHLSAAVLMVESSPMGRFRAALRKQLWGVHMFQKEEFKALLDQANFEPEIFHAWGLWMIVGGVRRPSGSLKETL